MRFKKRKDNQNKIKSSGRKRKLLKKVLATIALIVGLMFGKPRLSCSRSSSSNFDNQVVQERVIEERDFNSLDPQVILAKAEGKGSNTPGGVHGFPTAPVFKRPKRPVRPSSGYTPKIGPRIPPRVVDQGLGGAANPAGAGGGDGNAQFDDQCPVLKTGKKSDQLQNPNSFNQPKKNKNGKKSENQCPIDQPEVNESFKSNSSLKKVTQNALKNQDVKREYERIRKRISEGVDPMDIGRNPTDLGNGITYVRGGHGRYIVRDDNGVKDFVGIAYRGSRNDMKTLAKEMNKSYNVNIESGGY